MSTVKSSSANLTLNADGSGNDVIIQSNASTLVTVDGSTGNVGIGDTNPDEAKLSIDNVAAGDIGLKIVQAQAVAGLKVQQDGAGQGIYIDNNANERALYIEHDGTTNDALQIIDSALTTGKLAYFYSNTANTSTRDLVRIRNNHADATGTTSLLVEQDSTGLCADFLGSKIRTSGGILFGSDTAAANALDDYEEGTFTPTYVLATAGDSSWTYDRNAARYTKIGRQVFFEFFLRTDAYSNSTGSGSLKVSGLPFASSSTEFLYRAVCIRSAAFAANNNPINGHINTDETKINLNKRADANEQDESLDETSCTNGSNKNGIYATGSYTTD
jgi:hypothetical protein